MIVESETTLTFRASIELAEQTRSAAKLADLKVSEFIRDAVREKLQRQTAERMRFLSKHLSAQSAAMTDEFEATAGDGIA